MSKMIKIVQIYADRKECIAINGEHYTINDIKRMIKNNISVSVLVAKTSSGKEYIKYRKNCKEALFNDNMYHPNILNKTVGFGNKSFDIKVITEDKGSANTIILNIIEQFAIDNNIKINIKHIPVGGNDKLIYHILRSINRCEKVIITFDTGCFNNNPSILKLIKDIEKVSDLVSLAKHARIALFSPRCVEECALSFSQLLRDIKELTKEQENIIKSISNYAKNNKDYIVYNPINASYEFCGKPIHFGYAGIKLNKINNIEQLLTEELYKITEDKPYFFDKQASACWTDDCKSCKYACRLEEVIGTKTPRNNVKNCNKTALQVRKNKLIIENSLFQAIYESTAKILRIDTKYALNNTDVLKFYGV